MKKHILLFAFIFCILHLALPQNFDWLKKIEGAGTASILAQKADKFGNLYITGAFKDSIYIGNKKLKSINEMDFFIAKLDGSGNCVWAKSGGGTGNDSGNGLVLDASGNCFVTGFTNAGSKFDGYTFANKGGFLIKFDPYGKMSVITSFKANILGLNNIALDNSGNIYIAASFWGTVTIGSTAYTADGYYYNVLVIKIKPNGAIEWVRRSNGSDDSYATGIGIDGSGNIYICGYFERSVVFSSLSAGDANALSYQQIYVAKYDNSGNIIWLKTAGDPNDNDAPNGMAVDKSGNCYITGFSNGPGQFGDLSIEYTMEYMAFVAKLDTDGNFKWLNKGIFNGYGRAIHYAENNQLYVTGYYRNKISFQTSDTLRSQGLLDIYIAKFNTEGEALWKKSVGGSNNDNGFAICADPNGAVFFSGTFINNVKADHLTLSDTSLTREKYFTGKIQDNSFISSKLNRIKGTIYADKNANCIKENGENGLLGFVVKAEPGSYYSSTDANGEYSIETEPGTYTVSQIVTQHNGMTTHQVCPSSNGNYPNISFAGYYSEVTNKNFGNQVQTCPYLSVDVSSSRRLICRRSKTSISYMNSGFETAQNVEIHVTYPEYIIPLSSDLNWNELKGKTVIYKIGQLEPFQNGTITITDSVACNLSGFGLTQCVNATIYPINNCTLASPMWDGSDIKVYGNCIDGTARLVIKNIGEDNMNDSSAFRIFMDDELIADRKFKLKENDSIIVSVPANGKTIRLEADQRPYHPRVSKPSCFVEGCISNASTTISKGFVNRFQQDDDEDDVEISCRTITGSYDPNQKTASPSGLTNQNYIKAGQVLDYEIEFQNTGTDTAYTVVIVDTLSSFLDIATFSPGISSHPCTWKISGKSVPVIIWTFNNIFLPDSNRNKLGSMGFVKFKIGQNDNSEGTVITNRAGIYFDYNPAIITNTTIQTVNNYIASDFSKGKDITITNTLSTGIENSFEQKFSIYPNPTDSKINIQSIRAGSNAFKLELIDIYGKTLLKQEAKNMDEVTEMNLEKLEQGVYLLKISDGDQTQTYKIILN